MAKTNRALLSIIILPTCLIYLVTYTGKFTPIPVVVRKKKEKLEENNLNISSR